MNPSRAIVPLALVLVLATTAAAQQAPAPGEPATVAPDPVPSTVAPVSDAAPNRLLEDADPDAVLETFTRLIDRGRERVYFGLPETVTWRPAGPVRVALYSNQRASLAAPLETVIDDLAVASNHPIELIAARPLYGLAGAEAARKASGANLEVVVGPRPVMLQLAAAMPVPFAILERFEDGRWPYAFVFPRDNTLIGRVLIAADVAPGVVQSAMVLALVWGLGGVSLDEGVEGLIDRSLGQPTLTTLGAAVVALMYHPEIEPGLPISEALDRAEDLLGR